MFKEFINQLLGLEREPIPNRQDTFTAPDVTEKAVSSEPVPEKYKKTLKHSRANMGMLLKLDSVLILHFKRLYQSCRGKEEELIHTEGCNPI